MTVQRLTDSGEGMERKERESLFDRGAQWLQVFLRKKKKKKKGRPPIQRDRSVLFRREHESEEETEETPDCLQNLFRRFSRKKKGKTGR